MLNHHGRIVAFATVVLSTAAIGCGSSLKAPAPCNPAPGHGVMGVCTPKPKLQLVPTRLHGRFVPDVSEWNGRPNWTAAKRWGIAGAVIRVTDFALGRPDKQLAYNVREVRRLGLWYAFYAFLRPGNCAAEADTAVSYVRAVGGLRSGPLIGDAEVPLPASCVQVFVLRVEHDTGWSIAVVYTSPGTWPGGLHDHALLWGAAYGFAAPCVWTCHLVAWQYTQGLVGPEPHCISGIGCSDLSLDEGVTSLVRPHPNPKPKPHPKPSPYPSPHAQLVWLEGMRTQLGRTLVREGCTRLHPGSPRCLKWLWELVGTEARIVSLLKHGAH